MSNNSPLSLIYQSLTMMGSLSTSVVEHRFTALTNTLT